MKIDKIFQLKNVIFTPVKHRCMTHGSVFVMWSDLIDSIGFLEAVDMD